MTEISVVIPSYNSSRTIADCLTSLWNQTRLPSQIIVIDRFSTDGTARVAKQQGAMVVQHPGNRSVARNMGLELTRFPGVLFVDSDMVLTPNVIQECQEFLRKYDALIIPEISVGTGFWARCKSMERRTYYGSNLLEAARCFTKLAISSVKGFSPRLDAGEDWDLQRRISDAGYSVGRVKSIIVHNEGRPTLVSMIRKKFVYGKSMRTYLKANPREGLAQVNPFRRVIDPVIRTLPTNPLLGVGVFFLRTLEFSGAGLGYLLGPTTLSASTNLTANALTTDS